MNNLYNKLKNYTIDDAIKIEEEDRQFLALKELYYHKKMSNENYLFLIVINALICYQLSGKGEDYWEEFSNNFKNKSFKSFNEIYKNFKEFLPKSKNNKRFIETKLNRIKKLEKFYEKIKLHPRPLLEGEGIMEYYYKNMDKLVLDLSKTMNQKIDAKTIVFAVKMFSYGARNVFGYLEYFPENIMIPIDSRLENLYKKYSPHPSSLLKEREQKVDINKIKEFYINLSKKLNIPLLNLDAILWVNYEKLIK